MHCPNCGGRVSDQASQCPHCSSAQPLSEERQAEIAAGRRRRRRRQIRLWVGNLFLALVTGAAAWLAYLRVREPSRYEQLVGEVSLRVPQLVRAAVQTPPKELLRTIFDGRSAATWTIPTPTRSSTPTPRRPTSTRSRPTATRLPTATLVRTYVRITGDAKVNLREGPSTDYDIVSKASKGSRYDVTGVLSDRSWCRVKVDTGTAWIACYLDVVTLYNGDTAPVIRE